MNDPQAGDTLDIRIAGFDTAHEAKLARAYLISLGVPIHLEPPTLRHATDFLDAVRRSRQLHRGLVSPPRTRAQYRAYLTRFKQPSHAAHLVCLGDGELVGVVNISEIVRGAFQSAYLGYYAFAPHDGRGYMCTGLGLVIARAFRKVRLHRLEANIQPENEPSIALVKRLGFRLEGLSPRYLKVSGKWRDHQRWAVTVEDWRRAGAATRPSG